MHHVLFRSLHVLYATLQRSWRGVTISKRNSCDCSVDGYTLAAVQDALGGPTDGLLQNTSHSLRLGRLAFLDRS